ncbi:MAG: hypothetical protein H7338_15085 [Candidatus Sericytochromatia bacterium]|nr:hypothetical protein [Candidatus Sericytochromatia bacterium]
MREQIGHIPTAPGRLRRALGRTLLGFSLLAAACTVSPTPGLPTGSLRGADGDPAAGAASIRVSLTVPTDFAAKALSPRTAANINHITVKLLNWNGSIVTGTVAGTNHPTANNTVMTMHYSNVPAGMYKISAEAFSSPGTDTVSITQGGAQNSSNVVTVSGSGASYSVSGALNVILPLLPGIGDRLDTTVNVASGLGTGVSHLAPEDIASELTVHTVVTNVGGVSSDFVWIPLFTAYQLINPANCGSAVVPVGGSTLAMNTLPVGYWVSAVPGGAPNSDYRESKLGGIYVGKFEACHADAVVSPSTNPSDVGSSPAMAVKSNVAPWTNIDWDLAAKTCQEFHPACHLMGDDDWTAVAVWSMINNAVVKGNNNNNGDIGGAVTFTDDLTQSGTFRTLTGSGGLATSHNGLSTGVFDMNGNVSEWTASISRSNAFDRWVVAGADTFLTMPLITRSVVGLITDPLLAAYGAPLDGSTANASFGSDAVLFAGTGTTRKTHRGGCWSDGTDAGIWYMNMTQVRTANTNANIGFRPVLRF